MDRIRYIWIGLPITKNNTIITSSCISDINSTLTQKLITHGMRNRVRVSVRFFYYPYNHHDNYQHQEIMMLRSHLDQKKFGDVYSQGIVHPRVQLNQSKTVNEVQHLEVNKASVGGSFRQDLELRTTSFPAFAEQANRLVIFTTQRL